MKEREIRNRDAHNRYLDLVKEDAERLTRNKSQFIPIDCPICGGIHHSIEFEKIGFSYHLCSDCDTLFATPRPNYDDLLEIYANSESTRFWVEEFFLPVADARREKIFKPRAEHIASRFPDLSDCLMGDIGAGFGLFLEEMRTIWPLANIMAIEPSNDMAHICREKGISVIESMLEDVDVSDYQFDLLTSFELFEHLHDPLIFLRKVYDLLNPGGYLFLTTLNGMGFDIQLLWSKSKSVSPPHHLNFANPHSMTILLNRAGFTVEEVSTPGELDWDIIEGGFVNEQIDPGRFFKAVTKYGTEEAKRDLQSWIKDNGFSSHMRVIARKEVK